MWMVREETHGKQLFSCGLIQMIQQEEKRAGPALCRVQARALHGPPEPGPAPRGPETRPGSECIL